MSATFRGFSLVRTKPVCLVTQLARKEPPLRPTARADDATRPEARIRRIHRRFATLEAALTAPDADLRTQRRVARAVFGEPLRLRAGLLVQAERTLDATLARVRDALHARMKQREYAVIGALFEWDDSGESVQYHACVAAIDALDDADGSLPSLAGVAGDFFDDPPDLYGDGIDSDDEDEPDPEQDERDALRAQLEQRAGIPGVLDVLRCFETDFAAREVLFAWAEREGLLDPLSAGEVAATFETLRRHRAAYAMDLERLALLEGERGIANGSHGVQVRWARERGVIGPRTAAYLQRDLCVPDNWTGT
jgi:hypothetical protein